jgi:hypothetical protein
MLKWAVAGMLLVAGCAGQTSVPKPIEFLTRSGCVQTKSMRVRTEAAIKELALPNPYTVVDLDALPATDARRGYPTPTVLIGGVDLFDMPAPVPPVPDPT